MPRGVRAGLAALVLVAVAPLPAAGQDVGVSIDPLARSKAVDQELSRLAEQFEEGSADEARVVAEYQVSKREQASLDAEVRRLDAALAANGAALAKAEVERARAEAAATRAQQRLAEGRERVGQARERVRRVAVLSYIGQDQLDLAAQALEGADTATDLGVAFAYTRVVGHVQADIVDDLRRDEAGLGRLQLAAGDASRAARDRQADLATRQRDLASDRAARGDALVKAAAEVAVQARLLNKVRAVLAGYRQRMAELRSESAAIGALLRSRTLTPTTAVAPSPSRPPKAKPTLTTARRPATTAPPTTAVSRRASPTTRPPVTTRPSTATTRATTATTRAPPASPRPTAPIGPPPPTRVRLSYPIPGAPIVSGFGMRVQPILGIYRMHEGIDIWAPAGTPIHAAAAGVVIWAGPRGGYGNAVIIDHGGGLGTVYAHQSVVGVTVGQRLAAGQVVGYVGQTGLAAGPHLHFEVRVNGTAYDPLNFVRPG